MDQMLEIPKDRKRLRVGRLCLLIGLTVLLYLLIWREMGAVALAVTQGA
jgi:hypothetical protein